jgi:hypothetical protein
VTSRRLPWRLVFEAFHELNRPGSDPRLRDPDWIEAAIRAELPDSHRGVGMIVDLASTAPRPENPAVDHELLRLYDPISEQVEVEAAPQLLARLLPLRTLWLRVYSDSSDARMVIRNAAARALADVRATI